MEVKVGMRLRSAVDQTEVVVVRAPDLDVDLRCGGASLVDASQPATDGGALAGFSEGTLLGKRYADDELGLELLCIKPGAGSLSIADVPLGLKAAKLLPSSD